MEILSPQSLWKEYDRKALPLNPAVISSKEKDGVLTERLYFSGELTACGVTRIFAKLCLPQKIQKPSTVIIMNDLDTDADGFDALPLVGQGYAVLVVDYAGEREDKERFTIYPKSLGFANYFKNKNALSETPPNPKLSCWYVWTTILLRAITFAENDKRTCGDVAVVGVGAGGSQVFKTAALESLKCGVTVQSTHVTAKSDTNEEINFKACLDNISYAPLSRMPVLSEVCSNDSEGFFDRMSEIYGGSKGNYYLSVGERAGERLRPRQKNNIRLWLNQHLKMGLPLVVKPPEITARESEKSLYYDVKTDVRLPVSKVELFVAYSVRVGAFRNWRRIKPLMAGEGDYLAKVAVYDASQPVYAFANVYYENGFTFSTPLVAKLPAAIGVQADNFVKSRLLYDSDSGTDDFVSPDGGDDDVVMEKGVYGIEGVCSLTGTLATYKAGDVQFKAQPDSLLQLIAYSETSQEIEFSVRTEKSGGEMSYVCRRRIERDNNWTKLTLSAEEFKSSEGALPSFEQAVYFSVCSRSKLLLNSMLWV